MLSLEEWLGLGPALGTGDGVGGTDPEIVLLSIMG
jgi:hypothetical protein